MIKFRKATRRIWDVLEKQNIAHRQRSMERYVEAIGSDDAQAKEDSTSGVKYDNGKAPLSWISGYALEQEALVLLHGAQKYDRHNWRKGMEWSRLVDAAMRHIKAFNEGEDTDPESGYHHLAHARCCLAFLLDYTQTRPEFDDRYKPNL